MHHNFIVFGSGYHFIHSFCIRFLIKFAIKLLLSDHNLETHPRHHQESHQVLRQFSLISIRFLSQRSATQTYFGRDRLQVLILYF